MKAKIGDVRVAQDTHWIALAVPCGKHGCPNLARVTVRTFVMIDDLTDAELATIVTKHGELATVESPWGKLAVMGEASACPVHEKELMREAARKPDHYATQIDRGAGELRWV